MKSNKVTQDYYKEWSKIKESQKRELYHRERIALKIIKNIIKPNIKFLDLGCGDGFFMDQVIKIFKEIKVFGVDNSADELKKAKGKNLNVKRFNLEKRLPYNDGEFDIVYAGELIEHLFDPDFFLKEANRILKEKGYLLLSTPNLCAWFNRIIFPLGIQPVFMESSTKSKLIGAGILKRLKKEELPVGHIRIFNLDAILDLLKSQNFRIIHKEGAVFDSYFHNSIFLIIDKLFSLLHPSLAADLIILAQKIK
jgi:SAM-dependent methyltransferase